MFTKIRARTAAIKKAAANRAKQQALTRRLGVEVLEDRLAPAAVTTVWQGDPNNPGVGDWATAKYWRANVKPGAMDTAFINLAAAKPTLSVPETINGLMFRAGGNGTNPAGANTTTLDLNSKALVATTQTQVYSATGVALGGQLPNTVAGVAPEAVVTFASSVGPGTLTTGLLSVGAVGVTAGGGGRNKATLTIGKNVTVNVTNGRNPGNVVVGGTTVGRLTVDAGTLNASNLSAVGVSGPVGSQFISQVNFINGAQVALAGNIVLGAKNNYTGPARQGGNIPVTNLVVDSNAKVTLGTAGLNLANSLRIGDFTTGSAEVQGGATLTTFGNIKVGVDTNLPTGKGALFVRKDSTVTVGGLFTINKVGATTLDAGSAFDLKAGGVNNGTFSATKQAILKARMQGLKNNGKIIPVAANGGPGGVFALQGDFAQEADGHLEIQIAGNAPGVSYDQLQVSNLDDAPGGGNATLGGTLDVSSSYTPTPWLTGGAAGDYFTVVSASQSLTGQFDPLTGLNLPDPSTFASLPALPSGYGYQWHVIYDTTDSFDSNLAASDPAISSQPWAGNGTRDVVLVLEQAPLRPNLAVTSASPTGTNSVTVGYNVENQAVGQAFAVSLFTSQNGHTPDTPNTPFATVTVPGATLGAQTATIAFAGQTLPAGEQLIAVVDSGNAVAESSEYDNALVMGQIQASDGSAPAAAPVLAYDLTLASPSDVPVTVHYQTADGTALAGVDYTAVSGSVTFAPGQTQQEIDIPLLNANSGSDKTFLLHFSSPADGYFVGATGQVVAQADAHLTLTAPAPSGTVSGYAWQDDNTNHLWDQNESGIANVLVSLTEPGGAIVSTTTDFSGYYSFTGLTAGTYGVSTSAPAGTLLEGYYQGGSPASASVTLTGSQTAAEVDAAFVAGAATSTSLTSSNTAPYAGQSVTFTATVAATSGSVTPTGTMDFYDGGTWIGSGTLSPYMGTGATAAYSTAALSIGSHAITAVYGGDAAYAGSVSAALSETVQQPTTSTSLSVNPPTSAPGQTVTFTASVTGMGGSASPTGGVNFYEGATLLGSGTLVAGGMGAQATFGTASLSLGTHSVKAVYAGDGTYAGSTSSAVSEVVQAASTSTTVSASPASSTPGQTVTFTATVSSTSGGTPTGTVSFSDGTTALGTVTLTGGTGNSAQASLAVATLGLGGHTITATYSGASAYAGSSGSAGETVQMGSSYTGISVNPSASTQGQSVTFTATVSSMSGGTPTGAVNFYDGGGFLGTGTLTYNMGSQQATFTTSSLSVGSHPVTATYGGNGSINGSGSTPVTETVQAPMLASTSTTLGVNPASSTSGQAVTFTATVSSMGGGTPAGSVGFYDGATFLGTSVLTAGGMGSQATFTTSGLSVGYHSVTATYGGNASFGGSSSSSVTETVSQTTSSASVGLGSSATTVAAGQPVTFTATVSSTGTAPTGGVTFYDGATALGTVALGSGMGSPQASLTTSTLSVGAHSITAVYGGDTSHGSATSSAVTETVSQGAPASATISLSGSSQNAMAGMSVSFNATVSPPANGTAPTGSVTFYDGGTALGNVPLSSYMGTTMRAVFTTSSLAVGTHSVTAAYSGGGSYAGVTSTVASVTVQRASAMIMEMSSNTSAAYGTAVTFSATVSSGSPSVPPTGTVSFYDGATLLATVNLAYFNNSYRATFTTSSLSRGSHTIFAYYSGDQNYNLASASLTESIY